MRTKLIILDGEREDCDGDWYHIDEYRVQVIDEDNGEVVYETETYDSQAEAFVEARQYLINRRRKAKAALADYRGELKPVEVEEEPEEEPISGDEAFVEALSNGNIVNAAIRAVTGVVRGYQRAKYRNEHGLERPDRMAAVHARSEARREARQTRRSARFNA